MTATTKKISITAIDRNEESGGGLLLVEVSAARRGYQEIVGGVHIGPAPSPPYSRWHGTANDAPLVLHFGRIGRPGGYTVEPDDVCDLLKTIDGPQGGPGADRFEIDTAGIAKIREFAATARDQWRTNLAEALRKTENDFERAFALSEAKRTLRNEAMQAALAAGWTHAEIAADTGLTRGRVGQIAQTRGAK